jgi:hypothetical protein
VSYPPGTHVTTKPAADGGRDYLGDPVVGIVLDSFDGPDLVTGETCPLVVLLDCRTTRRMVTMVVPESALDPTSGYLDSAGLRRMRRVLHAVIAARSRTPKGNTRNPETDRAEIAAEQAIATLLRAELGGE